MKPHRARRSLAALVASVVAACNAISGLDGEYDLAVGKASPIEGGAESGGSRLDGSVGSIDSSPPLDAEVPDALGPPDGGGLNCASPPESPSGAMLVFCDNFDDSAAEGPLWGWSRRQITSGVPTLEPGGWVGRGLRADVATIGRAPHGEGWVTALWKKLEPELKDGQRVTMQLRFMVTATTLDYTVIAAIQLNGSEYGVALYRDPTCLTSGVCIDENDHYGRRDPAHAVPLVWNEWYRADITVTRSGLTFGGKVVLAGTTTPLDEQKIGVLPIGKPSMVEVGVGSFFSSSGGSANVVIDDVVVWRH